MPLKWDIPLSLALLGFLFGPEASAADVPLSDRDRAVAEFRKTAKEWIDELAAKEDDETLRKMTAQLSQDKDRLKGRSREELVVLGAEGATKGNLGAIRSGLSIYYGDLEGVYPDDLDHLTRNGKYLSKIPSANTGRHPKTNSVVISCDTSRLRDTGGWAYCNDPRNKNFGNVVVDCTHKDSKGNFWHGY